MVGKIFVNYRRDDDPNGAARVRDGLADAFGAANIFMDVDNLLAGQRFDHELASALAQCDLLIAIIGPRWSEILKSRATSGERDYVCGEISEALRRKIRIIPVLVGRDWQMPTLPRMEDLPEQIRDLVLHQKHDIAHERFGRDMAELVASIKAVRNAGTSKIISTARRRSPLSGVIVGLIALVVIAVSVAAYLSWPTLIVGLSAPVAGQARPEIAATDRATLNSDVAATKKATDEARAIEARRRRPVVAQGDQSLSVKPGSGQSFRDCDLCPEMVVVPAGSFVMGNIKGDPINTNPDNGIPFHTVTIKTPFALAKFTVTFEEGSVWP